MLAELSILEAVAIYIYVHYVRGYVGLYIYIRRRHVGAQTVSVAGVIVLPRSGLELSLLQAECDERRNLAACVYFMLIVGMPG